MNSACIPNALAIAMFSNTAIRGRIITADPSLDIIPPKSVISPVLVLLTLNGGILNLGIPDSKFPVRIKVVFLVSPLTSGRVGSQP